MLMKQSLFLEAAGRSASENIPFLLMQFVDSLQFSHHLTSEPYPEPH
jgi:hypothetical protein